MGIKGLLPALEKIKKRRNVQEYGGKAAIDGFAWLHRAAFTSVHEVVFGGDLRKPVEYCLRRAEGLRTRGVEPIFVFDGASLPSKAATNAARRQARHDAKARAEELKSEGRKAEAHKVLGQAVSISQELVSALIKACRECGIECIVAPYEADAQLGYLSHIGYVSVVISEDSDLLLYGCKEVLFKMDDLGDGVSVSASDLPKAGIFPPDQYHEDAFIVLCCLAGCDYADSVKGIGIKKGAKFVSKVFRGEKASQELEYELGTTPRNSMINEDKENIPEPKTPSMRLRMLTQELSAAGCDISDKYYEDLKRALYTFKYQTVFDPRTLSLARRFPLPNNVSEQLADFIGPIIDEDTARKVCSGEIDPHKHRPTCVSGVPYVARPPRTKKPNGALGSLLQSRLDFGSSFKSTAKVKSVPMGTLRRTNKSDRGRKRAFQVASREASLEPCTRTLAEPTYQESEPQKQLFSSSQSNKRAFGVSISLSNPSSPDTNKLEPRNVTLNDGHSTLNALSALDDFATADQEGLRQGRKRKRSPGGTPSRAVDARKKSKLSAEASSSPVIGEKINEIDDDLLSSSLASTVPSSLPSEVGLGKSMFAMLDQYKATT